jgi:hypothetical protein
VGGRRKTGQNRPILQRQKNLTYGEEFSMFSSKTSISRRFFCGVTVLLPGTVLGFRFSTTEIGQIFASTKPQWHPPPKNITTKEAQITLSVQIRVT